MLWLAAAVHARTRSSLQAEYSQIRLKRAEAVVKAFYLYGGLHITEKLVAHVQRDTSDITLGTSAPTVLPNLYTDTTVGLSYAFHPGVVVKAEHHWAKGRFIEDQPVPLRPGF